MEFPVCRPRRLRRTSVLRHLVKETGLTLNDLIYPLFIVPGEKQRRPIASLAGQFHLSPDEAALEAERLFAQGLSALLLFGLPAYKDPAGSSGAEPDGPVQAALRAIRKKVPEMILVTDVCLCEYTSHGHCGVLKNGQVDNDATLPLLAAQAVSHAEAGADVIAPSDMMDGRVAAIRGALDGGGFTEIPVMSYSVKYASAFYGPFREAADSTPQQGDRRGYQMDPANWREAFREVELDVAEGADFLMVKPAGPYLDVIRQIRDNFNLPLAAYQVSGEFAMIKSAAAAGLLDEQAAMLESLLSIKRAGADLVITYFAPQVLKWLR